MEAIEDARKAAEAELGVVLRWCFDIPGEAGLAAAEETLRLALRRLRPEGLVSFGLGGPEIGVPRPQFKPYFDRRVAAGLRSRAARRARPPARRRSGTRCTSCGAERIGHGTSAAQDPKLLAHLAEHAHRAGGLPDLEHRHPRGAAPRRAPDQGVRGGRACWSPSTPTTRRCSAPTSTTSTRSPPGCSTWTGRASPRSPRTRCEASFLDPAGKARVAAEIDAYAAANAEEADGERHRR